MWVPLSFWPVILGALVFGTAIVIYVVILNRED